MKASAQLAARALLALPLVCVPSLAAAQPARAQAERPPVVAKSIERAPLPTDTSPQHAAFELRFGPYSPKIDESTTRPVYDEFFGDSPRFMLGFELDWQIVRIPFVGPIGVGAGWGYTRIAAPNVIPPDAATPQTEDGTVSISQESSLSIMPFSALAVLRVDTLAKVARIPLVPYAKFGLSYALWWVNDGIGTARNDDGVSGRDISKGTQAALGAMFLLDILEPTAARALDSEGGVNNSYIFFEWSMSDYGGAQMNVGSNNWVTGFAFEM